MYGICCSCFFSLLSAAWRLFCRILVQTYTRRCALVWSCAWEMRRCRTICLRLFWSADLDTPSALGLFYIAGLFVSCDVCLCFRTSNVQYIPYHSMIVLCVFVFIFFLFFWHAIIVRTRFQMKIHDSVCVLVVLLLPLFSVHRHFRSAPQ